jgi:hypothetical protein
MNSFSGDGSSILSVVSRLPQSDSDTLLAESIPAHWSNKLRPKNPVAAYNLRNGMSRDHRTRAREHWRFAIHSVQKINRATSIFKPKKVDRSNMRVINSPNFPVSNLGFLLKSFQSKVFQ